MFYQLKTTELGGEKQLAAERPRRSLVIFKAIEGQSSLSQLFRADACAQRLRKAFAEKDVRPLCELLGNRNPGEMTWFGQLMVRFKRLSRIVTCRLE